MKTSATARKFAKALIAVGKEEGACEKFGAELKTVAEVFRAAPELSRVLMNPMYKLKERLSLTEKVASDLELSPEVARFLAILVDMRHIKSIEAVAEAYSLLEDQISGRIRATVESPTELDPATIESIKARLKAETGQEVLLTHKKNPALIGGIVIRMGNTILDGSIKTQLELMEEKILEGVV